VKLTIVNLMATIILLSIIELIAIVK